MTGSVRLGEKIANPAVAMSRKALIVGERIFRVSWNFKSLLEFQFNVDLMYFIEINFYHLKYDQNQGPQHYVN